MIKLLNVPLAGVATLFLLSGGAAQAITMADLVAGTSFVAGPVTFSGFDYEDVGGPFGDFPLDASDIEVDVNSSAGVATLLFYTPTLALDFEEVMEVVGSFTATIFGGGVLDYVTFSLDDAAASGVFSFLEFGSNTFGKSATVNDGAFAPQGFTEALGPMTTSKFIEWDMSAEVGDGQSDFAGASNFSISVGYSLPPVIMPAVPLPATLPLLLAGMVGVGLLGRRRKGA